MELVFVLFSVAMMVLETKKKKKEEKHVTDKNWREKLIRHKNKSKNIFLIVLFEEFQIPKINE